MKNKQHLFAILLIILSLNSIQCNSQNNCNKTFKSYNEAQQFLNQQTFSFTDIADCSESSWIIGAKYYSCDSKTGYFKYTTDSKTYIHEKLPISVWNNFKNAPSKGTYYNANIKHKYRLIPQ